MVDAEYVNRGSHLLLTLQDGQLLMIDAYRFTEEKIMDFYGEPAETTMLDQKHLLVRSNKNVLALFRQGWDEDLSQEFQKEYEIKLEEGDHYVATLECVLVFRRNAGIEVYSRTPVEVRPEWP